MESLDFDDRPFRSFLGFVPTNLASSSDEMDPLDTTMTNTILPLSDAPSLRFSILKNLCWYNRLSTWTTVVLNGGANLCTV